MYFFLRNKISLIHELVASVVQKSVESIDFIKEKKKIQTDIEV